MRSSFFHSFFKTPKHRSFQYEARYYDAEKEDLERRVRMVQSAGEIEEASNTRRKIKFSDRFKESMYDRNFNVRIRHQKTMSRIRFLIILNVILILVLFVFFKLI